MSRRKVVVVGAGPAGLLAAGEAAHAGADVILLEKKHIPACKLRITGKGRCNITNRAPVAGFITHFGKNGRFLHQAFSRFFSDDLLAILDDYGVETVVERGERIFPASSRALDVVDALISWAENAGVEIVTNVAVKQLQLDDGRVTGVSATSTYQEDESRFYAADAVIVATGGLSYPKTGSTGDGYRWAKDLSHKIVDPRPALVPLNTIGPIAPSLQGLSLRNVKVRVLVNEKKQAELFGEMLFTHFGLSGPIILSLSGQVVDAVRSGAAVTISIDLKPALDERKLDQRLLRDINEQGKKRFQSMLKGLLPKKLISACINEVGLSGNLLCHQITSAERKRLRLWLKDFRLVVAGPRPLAEAIITAGGVNTREIDPRTMESRLVPGVHFAGEVLDLNADTGGYNLQAAFSTGWVAGNAAAQSDKANQ